MAIYRCASCGSANIHTEIRTGELTYNYKKGIVGTAVLGSIGAVAGLESKEKYVFVCNDCGTVSDTPMDADLQFQIEMRLSTEALRSRSIQWKNQLLRWDTITAIYKNLGKGSADIKKDHELKDKSNCTRKEFDDAIDFVSPHLSSTNFYTLNEYQTLQQSIAIIIENLYLFLSYPLPKQYRDLIINKDRIIEMLIFYLETNIQRYCFEFPIIFVGYEVSDVVDKYISEFAKLNPFICHFIDTYCPLETYESISSYSTVKKAISPQEVAKHLYSERKYIRKLNWYRTITYTFPECNTLPKHIVYYVPRCICTDNNIGHWLTKKVIDAASNKYTIEYSIRNEDVERYLMQEYFKLYPNKKIEYEKMISEYHQLTANVKRYEERRKDLQSQNTYKKEVIKDYKDSIQRLEKKIFGKTKAQAEINRLLDEIKILEENISKNTSAITKINNTIKNTPNTYEFYEMLFEEMDYFITWHWSE